MTDMPASNDVTSLIKDIRCKLEEAVSIAKAAESCALDGSVDRALQILTDFEGLVHEARDLFKAALTIKCNLFAETT
jgi:hypothetical protein